MLLWLYSAGGFYRIFCSSLLEVAKYKPKALDFGIFQLPVLLIGLVIAVIADLPCNPSVELEKVLCQLRPVVVKFVHCVCYFIKTIGPAKL